MKTTNRVLTTILAVAALVLLLLSTTTLAAIQPATLAGGHYILTGLDPGSLPDGTWQVSGAASGGGYRLLAGGRSAPASAGSGCCCTYLPCALRSSHP